MATTKLVPREGKDGIRFYVSEDALEAYKILNNGARINVRATPTTCENCKVQNNAKRKQRYLQFCDALGYHRHILASHAVHVAWIGPIPDGYVVDHLNGITTDNRASNLQAVSPAENARRVPYLHALRDTIPHHWQTFTREDYLRFYAMPFDDFCALLARFPAGGFEASCARIDHDLTHHCEI